MKIAWSERAAPLEPIAVAGIGSVAAALARATARRDEAELARLLAFGSDDGGAFVVIGDPASLPWREGVAYLGRDPAAPRLLLPTTRAPSVAPELLERAVLARLGAAAASARVVVIPDAQQLICLPSERAMDRALLEAWAEKHRAA